MKNSTPSLNRSGFTLMEMLIAMAILALAMSLVWQSFTMILSAQRRGEDLLDGLHHGEYVMDSLVEGLRSAAFYQAAQNRFSFVLEPGEGTQYPQDRISWVKTGPAFIPPTSPLAYGMHRIEFTVGDEAEGLRGALVRAYPHMAGEDDPVHALDPQLVSATVLGFRCRVYDPETEWWVEEWEAGMVMPGLLELTLYLAPLEEGGDPVVMRRVVDIPVSTQLRTAARFVEPERTPTRAGGAAARPARRSRRAPARGTGGRDAPARTQREPGAQPGERR